MAGIVDINNLVHLISDQSIEKTTNLYMITRKKLNGQFVYNVLSAETQNDVAQQLNESFMGQLSKIQSNHKEFRDYEIDDSSNDYVQYIKVDHVSTAAEILQTINNNNAVHFISDAETFSNLWAYAVKIKINNKSLVWFRKYNKGKVLKKGAKDAILFQNGTFSKIEHDVFQVDEKVDCFCWNDEIFISQHHNFEKIFNYEDQ
jgi:hypothetical protein